VTAKYDTWQRDIVVKFGGKLGNVDRVLRISSSNCCHDESWSPSCA
jgi:hypothetical protein